MLTLVAVVEAYETALDMDERASVEVIVFCEVGRSRYVRSLTSVENDMMGDVVFALSTRPWYKVCDH